jgi:hypothetical protein
LLSDGRRAIAIAGDFIRARMDEAPAERAAA